MNTLKKPCAITKIFNQEKTQNIIRFHYICSGVEGQRWTLVATLLWREHGVLYSQSYSKGSKAPLESSQQNFRQSHSTSEAAWIPPRLVAAKKGKVTGEKDMQRCHITPNIRRYQKFITHGQKYWPCPWIFETPGSQPLLCELQRRSLSLPLSPIWHGQLAVAVVTSHTGNISKQAIFFNLHLTGRLCFASCVICVLLNETRSLSVGSANGSSSLNTNMFKLQRNYYFQTTGRSLFWPNLQLIFGIWV